MAIAHFSVKARTVSQSGGARNVVQYIMREGKYAPKHEDVDYLTRQEPSSANRDDLRHVETGNLPAWAGGNPAVFFAKAEQHERANGRYAYALQFSLARELSHEQQLALTRDFIEATMHNKPYVWVKHEPMSKTDGLSQPHIHILMSARRVDGIERLPAQSFSRWNGKQPEKGGMQKDDFWRQKGAIEHLRFAFADLTNYHLERAGYAAQIDPQSLRKRGIDRKPQLKGHPGHLERDSADEQAKAVATWQLRKAFLQMPQVQHIAPQVFVQQVRQRTRNIVPGKQLPRRPRTPNVSVAAPQGRVRVEHQLQQLRLQRLQRERLTVRHGMQADLKRDEREGSRP